jgi:hypothetical protein
MAERFTSITSIEVAFTAYPAGAENVLDCQFQSSTSTEQRINNKLAAGSARSSGQGACRMCKQREVRSAQKLLLFLVAVCRYSFAISHKLFLMIARLLLSSNGCLSAVAILLAVCHCCHYHCQKQLVQHVLSAYYSENNEVRFKGAASWAQGKTETSSC